MKQLAIYVKIPYLGSVNSLCCSNSPSALNGRPKTDNGAFQLNIFPVSLTAHNHSDFI